MKDTHAAGTAATLLNFPWEHRIGHRIAVSGEFPHPGQFIDVVYEIYHCDIFFVPKAPHGGAFEVPNIQVGPPPVSPRKIRGAPYRASIGDLSNRKVSPDSSEWD